MTAILYEVIELFQPCIYFGFVFYLVKRLFTQTAPIRERDGGKYIIYFIVPGYIMSSRNGFYSSSELLAHSFLFLFFELVQLKDYAY